MKYDKETKTLTISYDFNEKLKNIQEDIEIIIFENNNYSKFNQKVDNLPQNLTYLNLGCNFNQKVDKLPKNITEIIFDFCFNQPVDNLPERLTKITFGYCFNKKVDNLPDSLTQITFGKMFNQMIEKMPLSIKEVKIYNISLITKIPSECEIIELK